MLRIIVEKRWTVHDWSSMLDAVDRFYLFFALARIADHALARNPDHVDTLSPSGRDVPYVINDLIEIHNYISSADELLVRRISYASPGSVDLLGVSGLVGHLKDLIICLLNHISSKRERSIRAKLLELDVELGQIKVIREHISIMKDLGYSDVQCQMALIEMKSSAQAFLVLAEEGKITGIESTDGRG